MWIFKASGETPYISPPNRRLGTCSSHGDIFDTGVLMPRWFVRRGACYHGRCRIASYGAKIPFPVCLVPTFYNDAALIKFILCAVLDYGQDRSNLSHLTNQSRFSCYLGQTTIDEASRIANKEKLLFRLMSATRSFHNSACSVH